MEHPPEAAAMNSLHIALGRTFFVRGAVTPFHSIQEELTKEN
jgi:hypothetical protein